MFQKFSWKHLLPVGLLAAVFMASYWFFSGEPIPVSIGIFAAVLVSSLPIPWLLSCPVALWRARKKALAAGIELPDKDLLAALARMDTLLLGRCGIITSGEPYIASTTPIGTNRAALLTMAASAEREAKHPIGKAIVKFAEEHNLRIVDPVTTNEMPGKGIEAIVNRSPIRVGRPDWLQEEGISLEAEYLTRADQISVKGLQPIFVTDSRYLRGILVLDDDIQPGIVPALRDIRQMGIRTVLLTSDNARIARATEKQIEVDEAHGNVTAVGWQKEVRARQSRGNCVAVLGAPSFGEDSLVAPDADLGVTPLADVATLVTIARHAMRIVHQNQTISVITAIMLLLPSMGLLHAFGGPFMPPFLPAIVLVLVSILILVNSLRA